MGGVCLIKCLFDCSEKSQPSTRTHTHTRLGGCAAREVSSGLGMLYQFVCNEKADPAHAMVGVGRQLYVQEFVRLLGRPFVNAAGLVWSDQV